MLLLNVGAMQVSFQFERSRRRLLQSYHFEHGQASSQVIAVGIDATVVPFDASGIQVRGAMRRGGARPRYAIDFDFANLAATMLFL